MVLLLDLVQAGEPGTLWVYHSCIIRNERRGRQGREAFSSYERKREKIRRRGPRSEKGVSQGWQGVLKHLHPQIAEYTNRSITGVRI